MNECNINSDEFSFASNFSFIFWNHFRGTHKNYEDLVVPRLTVSTRRTLHNQSKTKVMNYLQAKSNFFIDIFLYNNIYVTL